MKKKFTIFVLMFLATMVNAKVWTVDNNVNSPAQFKGVSALQDGINGASNGDTLYVSGSITPYPDVNLNKRLTLIGPGYIPQNEISIPATLGSINLDSVAGSGPSFSRIFGFKMVRVWQANSGFHYSGIEIARNYFYTAGTFANFNNSYNFFVHNNIFNLSYFAFGDNSIISNNIFVAPANGLQQVGQNSILSHNIFLGAVTGNSNPDWTGITLENNIFYGIKLDTTNTNIISCNFYNNIGFGGNYITLPFGTSNAGSGNYVSTNPQFVNVPQPYTTFNFNQDFHLTVHRLSTDGTTDIGLYGGAVNSVPDLTGMGRMPYMKYLHVTQSIIAPSDSLNVQFKAIKHN